MIPEFLKNVCLDGFTFDTEFNCFILYIEGYEKCFIELPLDTLKKCLPKHHLQKGMHYDIEMYPTFADDDLPEDEKEMEWALNCYTVNLILLPFEEVYEGFYFRGGARAFYG